MHNTKFFFATKGFKSWKEGRNAFCPKQHLKKGLARYLPCETTIMSIFHQSNFVDF